MTLGQFEPHAGDLAPGDRGVLETPWSSLTIDRVTSTSDPSFEQAYELLWREFGERGEMERRDVIADRLAWDPARNIGGYALGYEMLVLREHGDIIAVRDHSVIVPPAGTVPCEIVVHLSHVLVAPAMRGRGIAAWLRALPISSARRCYYAARATGAVTIPPITLVAEMEHDDGHTDAVRRRLRSYARAGFRMVDPALVRYSQPDFRAAAEIDASTVRAVPLCLVIRRVGREHENSIGAGELRGIVDALYAMFAVHVRNDHMDSVRDLLSLPATAESRGQDADQQVSLVVPGLAPPADRRVIK